jgi:hypothetical protein
MTRARLNGGILGLNNTTSLTSAYGVFALAEQQYYVQANKWPTVPPSTINISSSLRWRSSASAYMTRTPAVAGNRQKFTMSMWIKRGTTTSTGQWIFGASSGSANQDCYLCWGGSVSTGGSQDTLAFFSPPAGNNVSLITTAVYRDFSAWYHIVCAVDTTQATAANRILLYVNGAQVTSFSTATYPTLNQNLNFNNTQPHLIGSASVTPANFLDGYLAEFNYVDGQQLTASSFGIYDGNGIWQPSGYNGSYGTTGFHLTFGNTTSTGTLGNDTSGNGNNFTTNNFSLTAGSTYDAMLDSPTPYSTTVGNYAVINPLITATGNGGAVTNGNLTYTLSGTFGTREVTLTNSSLLQYAEFYITSGVPGFGVKTPGLNLTTNPGTPPAGYWGIYDNGATFNIIANGSIPYSTGTTVGAGQTWQVVYNPVTGNAWIGKNNVYYNSTGGTTGNPSTGANPTFTGLSSGLVIWVGGGNVSGVVNANFGQQAFVYTPPTGYTLPMQTYNLPASTIPNGAAYFASTLYTGNGTNSPNALIITNSAYNNAGTAFQPDFTWVKSRSLVSDHILQDSVRGLSEFLVSDTTGAAQATGGGDVSAYTSTGFNISYNNTRDNQASATYVAWQWQAGKGVTATNTNGTITSTVSANQTAGFSIISYTGNTTSGATVGHGLGAVPSMMIIKSRTNGTDGWVIYHVSVGNTKALFFDTSTGTTQAAYWNNTTPTSSVFTLGFGTGANNTTPNIAYCWAPIAGYSAFGSYTGNGSTDGPFIYLGFRPRWWLVKRTDAVESWNILDSSRDTYNQAGVNLYPNLTNAESSNDLADLISNGVKLRNTWTGANTSGGTYIYAAFAENPFNAARAR